MATFTTQNSLKLPHTICQIYCGSCTDRQTYIIGQGLSLCPGFAILTPRLAAGQMASPPAANLAQTITHCIRQRRTCSRQTIRQRFLQYMYTAEVVYFKDSCSQPCVSERGRGGTRDRTLNADVREANSRPI